MTNSTDNKRQRRMAREPKADQVVETQEKVVSAKAASQKASGLPKPKEPTKTEKVLALLSRTEGATLDELIEATGWLPHTTRAVMTGLKKKGHAIQRTKSDGVSRYGLTGTAQ